ncbi:MAG: radical SAM protein [Bacteroidaceae bacterium]|nr:radical SAM protein [Bacteroidaceae bacterium]
MSTIIYPSPIFGPVHSRRLGVSLGINLMPADGKVCTFDCIYCECGFNADHRPTLKRPTREEVSTALEAKLRRMKDEGVLPDVLTFAGNGEPTAHPDFLNIIKDTITLRNRYCPAAKVSVLSNATLIMRPQVFEALMLVDNNILKLDTVNTEYIRIVNRPTGHYDVRELIEKMKEFRGHCIVQTMFMHGISNGQDVGNLTDKYIDPWLKAVKEISPQQVMIYTIDRETPDHGLSKATHEELDSIVARIEAMGIKASASY